MAIHRLSASSPYVQVSLSANGLRGEYIALIDTGASMTSLHPGVIKALELQVIGAVDLKQVGEELEMVPTYYLVMGLESISPMVGIEVVSAAPASPRDMIVGRDLMSRWLMSWDGPDDRLLISY